MWFPALYHYSTISVRCRDAGRMAFFPYFAISLCCKCTLHLVCLKVWASFLGELGKGPIWLYCWSSMEEGHKSSMRTLSSKGYKPMKHPLALLASGAVLLVYLSLLLYWLVVCIKYFCSYCTFAHLGEAVAEQTQEKCFAAPKACNNSALFSWKVHAIIRTERCLLDCPVLPHDMGKPI